MRAFRILSVATLASFLASGCSTLHKKESEEHAALQGQLAEMRNLIQQQNSQIEGLEVKLSTLNHRLAEAQPEKTPKPTPVVPHPAHGAGTEVEIPIASNDPEIGMLNDAAIGSFRQGRILYQAGKYPEAILAFSAFLERYPDHPLSGSAQFHVGDSYFKQNEYQLAVQEYQRVLSRYPLSPQISDTLKQLAAAEDLLKKPEQAARHRQMLLTLFPQSPAAQELQNNPTTRSSVNQNEVASSKAPVPETKTAPTPGFLDEPPATAPGLAQ
jgi:tol-pal system protein YbgF